MNTECDIILSEIFLFFNFEKYGFKWDDWKRWNNIKYLLKDSVISIIYILSQVDIERRSQVCDSEFCFSLT